MTLICISPAKDFSFLWHACWRHVASDRGRKKKETGIDRPCGVVLRRNTFIKAVRNVPDVCRDAASHNHICKSSGREHVPAMFILWFSATRPIVGRAFHADRSTEWVTDSRVLETNKHYAKHSLNFIFFSRTFKFILIFFNVHFYDWKVRIQIILLRSQLAIF